MALLICPKCYLDMKIQNESDALKAMSLIHDKGVKIVVFSSTELEGKQQGEEVLVALASKKLASGIEVICF